MRETAEAINDQAMRWVARIDRAEPSDALAADLEAWLAGDPRRRGAFLRAEAAWRALDRAAVPIDMAQEEDHTDRVEHRSPRVSRRWMVAGAGGLAASLALGIGLFALPDVATTRIDTARGEIRRVPLDDGSMAVVNTGSRLAVQLRSDQRNVELDSGEAWFQVAKQPTRPFVVSAGDVRVRAVGTAFSVRRHGGGADVQVTEGVVEAWVAGNAARPLRIGQGERAFIPTTGGATTSNAAAIEIDRSLAWRTGQIVLEGNTLGEAAAEFNRYNDRQIVIADPGLAAENLVGRFRTNEPEAFVDAVAVTLGARVENAANTIRVERADPE